MQVLALLSFCKNRGISASLDIIVYIIKTKQTYLNVEVKFINTIMTLGIIVGFIIKVPGHIKNKESGYGALTNRALLTFKNLSSSSLETPCLLTIF